MRDREGRLSIAYDDNGRRVSIESRFFLFCFIWLNCTKETFSILYLAWAHIRQRLTHRKQHRTKLALTTNVAKEAAEVAANEAVAVNFQ